MLKKEKTREEMISLFEGDKERRGDKSISIRLSCELDLRDDGGLYGCIDYM